MGHTIVNEIGKSHSSLDKWLLCMENVPGPIPGSSRKDFEDLMIDTLENQSERTILS